MTFSPSYSTHFFIILPQLVFLFIFFPTRKRKVNFLVCGWACRNCRKYTRPHHNERVRKQSTTIWFECCDFIWRKSYKLSATTRYRKTNNNYLSSETRIGVEQHMETHWKRSDGNKSKWRIIWCTLILNVFQQTSEWIAHRESISIHISKIFHIPRHKREMKWAADSITPSKNRNNEK